MIAICCALRTLVRDCVGPRVSACDAGRVGRLERTHVGQGLWLSTVLTLALVVGHVLMSVLKGVEVSGDSPCVSWYELGQLQGAFVFLARVPRACCYRNVSPHASSCPALEAGLPRPPGVVVLSFSWVHFVYFMEYLFFSHIVPRGANDCNCCLLNATRQTAFFFFLIVDTPKNVGRSTMRNFPVKEPICTAASDLPISFII